MSIEIDNAILYSTPPIEIDKENNDFHHKGYFDEWNVDLNKITNSSGLLGLDITPQGKRKIDLGKYNKEFEINKQLNYIKQKEQRDNILKKMSYEENTHTFNDITIKEILENTKKTWYDIMDDIIDGNISKNTFISEERLFYVGITIVVIVIFIYIYISFFE